MYPNIKIHPTEKIMKIAFIYAGQGSQYVGMGKEFYKECTTFRKIFDNSPVEFDLKKTCFENNNNLNKTEYTQPCITAYQIGITNVLLENGIKPEYVAGISLGEYAALYTAGVWTANKTIEIVSFRGKIMEDCVKELDCKTVSIIGLSNDFVEKICKECSNLGVVEITNYCCSGNITIGGERLAVDAAVKTAYSQGAKHCIKLKSDYPFHTKLLQIAGEKLFEYINKTDMEEMKVPVVFNYTGSPLKENESIPYLLKMQVQNCIYLEKSIRYLANMGVDTIIEIGPQNNISNIIKRICPTMKVFPVDEPKSIKYLIHHITS